MTIGEKIQTLRKQNGYSQEQLAEKITISRQAVSKWELGESIPDIENIVQLSKVFDVSTDYLLKNDTSRDASQDEVKPKPAVRDQKRDESDEWDEWDDDDEDEDEPDTIVGVLSENRYIIAAVIYFIAGFVWNLWHVAWIVFLLATFVPFTSRSPHKYVFAVAVVIYFIMGFGFSLWGMGWIVFLIAVPVSELARVILSKEAAHRD